MLNPYIGNSQQISGVLMYTLCNGKGAGMKFYRVRNGLGLDITISLDRASDISAVSFKGVNMGYLCPNGDVAPAFYEREGAGFLKSYSGGFITTCGLNNIGVASVDNGENFGLHGSISNTPSDSFHFTEDENEIVVYATIKDGELFKHRLTFNRKYIISKKENKIKIVDTVTNEGVNPEAIIILYHMNMGYPLLDENAKLSINSHSVKPRDDEAKKGIDRWNVFEKPTKDYNEQVFYHEIDEQFGVAQIFNEKINKGVKITFDRTTLDKMIQWKMMGVNDYVLGLEPANHDLTGRGNLRETGRLKELGGYESITFNLEIDFLDEFISERDDV